MLEVFRKNDLTLAVTVKGEDGNALDLTGATCSFVVKSKTAAVITKTPTITDAVAGTVEITLTNSDTDLATGDYAYELLVVDAAGMRYTALTGELKVKASLTA